MTPAPTTVRELLGRYDGVLLDVYGVLMDARGPLPGAVELLAALAERPYAIVTNDASRSPATYAARFANHGIAVPADRFVTSGSLLDGVKRLRGGRMTTESVVMRASSGTVRWIKGEHRVG